MIRISALGFVLLVAGIKFGAAQDNANLAAGWKSASTFMANDAQQTFVQAHHDAKDKDSQREADFGEAVSLLNVQPKTDANLDRATGLFQSVRSSDHSDDWAVASLYFQARIEQYQRLPSNLPLALQYYQELWTKYPSSFWGQQAAIRMALIEIYSNGKSSQEQSQLLAKYEQIGSQFSDPQSRRDIFYILGRSYMNLGLSPEKALDDLLQTQTFGFSLSGDRSDNYVRIAELARQVNRNDIAIVYYRKLIDEFPFDSRVYTLKQRLASLNAPTMTRNP